MAPFLLILHVLTYQMTLIDTHTHLYLPEFDNDREKAVARALSSGVSKMLLPNIDSKSLSEIMRVTRQYPGVCLPMTGLHPTSVKPDFEKELEALFPEAGDHKFVAIGETGIDLYWDKTYLEQQIESFIKHINAALRFGLPIVIHARESFGVILEILSDYSQSGLTGVFHAFTGTADDMKKALDLGFMLGIGGIITFKNSGLAATISGADISRIILETDSPYLAPSPHRGKRNESSYLSIINGKVASLFGITSDESAAITTANATRLFKLNNLTS